MGRIFESLRDAGAVTDDVDLRFGTYEDRSVYRNAISATGAPQWIATRFGWGLNFAGSQRLSRGTTTTPSAVLVVGAIPNMCDQDSRVIQFDGSGLSLAIINQSSLLTVATGATARANLGLRSSLAYIVNFAPLEVYAENGKTTAAALAGAPSTSTMVVGNINAGVTPIQSNINKISTFNTAISQTQAQDLLAELLSERFPTKAYSIMPNARSDGFRVDFDLNLSYAPVTLANVSTINAELADNLRLVSGTWSIPTDKTATCVAAGTLWARMQAFGSLRTTMQSPGDTMQIGFASVRGAPNATAQNGYWARIDGGTFRITKSAAGAETTLASGGVATAGVAYDVQLDWETDGTLTLWTRRKGTGPFEVACSVVDTAIVASEYVCMYASAAGCKFGPRISHNEIALTPQEWGG
jgi:hypothetical protein